MNFTPITAFVCPTCPARLSPMIKPVDIRKASIEKLQDGADRIDNFLATMDSGHSDRAAILNDKCTVYYVKWKKSGVPEDVVKAVQAGRAAVEALTPNETSKGPVFNKLAASLKGRFRYSSQAEDLEDAIKYGKRVLTCFAHGTHQWRAANANLCDMICDKGCFYRTKESLDEAFEFLEHAGAPGIQPTFYESSRLSYLSAVLVSRFEATGSVQDLERGIEAGYKSIETLRDGAIRDHEYMNTSAALITHFHLTGYLNSLEEAI
ncbi:hypothetical protein GCG54_00012463 [Colletotrichum gloeosporioides]|uniref:Uncharacterized protein n=1 Tax=Colletotrichum gloeosporioides TaxID=474922 RepID=A0A8H4CED5_COLGL|nr:uncharacterized protein GCG54_00012463 [Colletotrichum gloeosporioides]KAF3802216.1 hypothetical protein GCG54_00012463 [Colletotrichum gloeosporioides]